MEHIQHMSTTMAAKLLGVHKTTVQRQINAGGLKAEMLKANQGGGSHGLSNMIPVEEVLKRLDTEGRILWYESQSGITATVSAADLATYKAAFGEKGIAELAERQQAVMALDGILNSGERGKRTAAIEELAAAHGVTSRTLQRWHAAYKTGGLAAIMDKVERKDKGKTRSMCQLAQDYIEAQMCDERKFPQNLILEHLRIRQMELGSEACSLCPYCDGSRARKELKPKDLGRFPVCTESRGEIIIPENRHAVNRLVGTLNKQQIHYGQYGKRAWQAVYMQKTKRKKPTMVNEVWFGDHHKLDLFVLDEEGRLVRPWMTAWMDGYSGKFVGVILTLEPNTDTVTESFRRAALYTVDSDVYGLPCYEYTDNGKDYRSSMFEGDRYIERDLGKLNIEFEDKSMLQTPYVVVRGGGSYAQGMSGGTSIGYRIVTVYCYVPRANGNLAALVADAKVAMKALRSQLMPTGNEGPEMIEQDYDARSQSIEYRVLRAEV